MQDIRMTPLADANNAHNASSSDATDTTVSTTDTVHESDSDSPVDSPVEAISPVAAIVNHHHDRPSAPRETSSSSSAMTMPVRVVYQLEEDESEDELAYSAR